MENLNVTLIAHVVRHQTSVKDKLALDIKFPCRNSRERDNILLAERCSFQECVSVTFLAMTHSSRRSVSWVNGAVQGIVHRGTSQLTKHQQRVVGCEQAYVGSHDTRLYDSTQTSLE